MFCKECGAENNDNNKFCGECGTKLSQSDTENIKKPEIKEINENNNALSSKRTIKPKVESSTKDDSITLKDKDTKNGFEKEIDILIENFKSPYKSVGDSAVNSLVKIGEPVIPSMINCLKNPNALVRARACDVLGQIEDSCPISHLIKMLKDTDIYVRKSAINALMNFNDPNSIEPLIEALNDPEDDVVVLAAKALKYKSDERIVNPLIPLLKNQNEDIRYAAADTLITLHHSGFEFDDFKKADNIVIEHQKKINNAKMQQASFKSYREIEIPIQNSIRDFKDSNSSIRNSAVQSIVKIGKPAVPSMINCLDNPDSIVRRKACDALGLMDDTRAVEPLNKMLKDSNRHVRRRAANALIKVGDESSIKPLIEALEDSEEKVRMRAAEALGKIGDESAIMPLNRLKSDYYDKVSKAAVDAIDAINSRGIKVSNTVKIENLILDLASDSNSVCNNAVNDLVKIGEPAVEPLLRCLKVGYNYADKYGQQKRKVCDVLGLIGDSRAVEPLNRMLRDEDKHVRRRAANALINIGDKRSVKPLIKALKDSEKKVRMRAAEALGKIGEYTAYRPLLKCLNDNDSKVREAAYNSLITIQSSDIKDKLKISKDDILEMENSKEIESIIFLVNNADTDIRKEVIKSLQSIGDSKSIETLKFLSSDSDPEIATSANAAWRKAMNEGFKTEGDLVSKNPMIEISFYESMPGRLSLDSEKSYISGIMELDEKEIIIHKKSFWRGVDRGTKHIRYDKITSIDFDEGKILALPSIQIYLSSIEYSFKSGDSRLKSFYDLIREKIDMINTTQETNVVSEISPMDELKKLAELRDMGIVTEEEFELKKKQLLGL